MHPFAATPLILRAKRVKDFARLLVFTLILFGGLPAAAAEQSEAAHKAQEAAAKAAGFIALSESDMTWEQAKAFCSQAGGKLPLIGGSNSLPNIPKGTPIEGFGAVGGPWPASLPSDGYWTGTEPAAYPGYSWYVIDFGGSVDVFRHQGFTSRVVCVP